MNTEFSSIFYEVKGEAEAEYARKNLSNTASNSHIKLTGQKMVDKDLSTTRDRRPMKNSNDYHERSGRAREAKEIYDGARSALSNKRGYQKMRMGDHPSDNSNDRKRKAANECGLMDYDLI